MQDHQTWRREARCLGLPIQDVNKLFYFERGGKSAKAKEFCQECPVQDKCLAYAVYYNERGGVYGGLTETERDELPELIRNLLLNVDIYRGEIRGPMETWLGSMVTKDSSLQPIE